MNEVENYDNEELIETLTARDSDAKILSNVRAGTRKRSKLKYRFNYLCLYFNT